MNLQTFSPKVYYLLLKINPLSSWQIKSKDHQLKIDDNLKPNGNNFILVQSPSHTQHSEESSSGKTTVPGAAVFQTTEEMMRVRLKQICFHIFFNLENLRRVLRLSD